MKNSEDLSGNEILIGEIEFVSSISEKSVPFMLLPPKQSTKQVIDITSEIWKLPFPQVALMILPSSSPKAMWRDEDGVSAFVEGVVKAAKATKMWIFTVGFNESISKELGKRFQLSLLPFWDLNDPYRVNPLESSLIGVCHRESLTYHHQFVERDAPLSVFNGKYLQTEVIHDLSPNHTHFIILQGFPKSQGAVHEFLRNVAKELMVIDRDEVESPLSVIMILIQGDASLLDEVLGHLRNHLPVIVIDGSGGLANLLGFVYREIQWVPEGTPFPEYVEKLVKPKVYQLVSKLFLVESDTQISLSQFHDMLMECVAYGKSNQLTILDPKECDLSKMSTHILTAIFNWREHEYQEESVKIRQDILLSMEWNCPKVADEEIFEKFDARVENLYFEKALLMKDREGFVDLVLKRGFSVHMFLTSTQLLVLYAKSLDDKFFEAIIWSGWAHKYPDERMTSSFLEVDLNAFIEQFSAISNFVCLEELDVNYEGHHSSMQLAEQKAIVLLVVWAALCYRLELVKVLWKHSEIPISLALFINILLKNIMNLPFVDAFGQVEIKKYCEEYSRLAVAVLDASYQDSPSKAYGIIREENPIFGHQNAMALAAWGENKYFLTHQCCQNWIDCEFMGNIQLKKDERAIKAPNGLKILHSAFFIVPMYFWISFRRPVARFADVSVGKKKENEKHARGSEPPEDFDKDEKFTTITGEALDLRFPVYEPVHYVQVDPDVFTKIKYLWSAPITCFWVFIVSYFSYLFFSSISLVYTSCGNPTLDTVLCFWTGLLIMNFSYNAFSRKRKNRVIPLKWNYLEIVLLVCILLTFLTKLGAFGHTPLKPYSIKLLYAFEVLLAFYRATFLSFRISHSLGPVLYRLKRMLLLDFLNFMRVASVLTLSNAVVIHAILYPDFKLSLHLLHRLLYKSYIYLFYFPSGEIEAAPSDSLEYNDHVYDTKDCQVSKYLNQFCPHTGIWPYIFIVQYVMLLNLVFRPFLFSLFGATHRKYLVESLSIWKYERYRLIVEFSQRSLPPPISLIVFAFKIIKRGRRCASASSHSSKGPGSYFGFSAKSDKYWSNLSKIYSDQLEHKKISEEQRETDGINQLKVSLMLEKKRTMELENGICELQSRVKQACGCIHTESKTEGTSDRH